MLIVQSRESLAEQLADWRSHGDHVALVPTMGNLHQGHIALVESAREHAERVIVSIFVNPTQFGEGEDYEDYPRTLERDTRRLKKVGADMIFAPDWDGAHLEKFGLEDAKAYHCWIVVDGRIVEALDASTPDLEGRYVAAFDAIAADSGAAALSSVAVPVGVSAIRPD